MPLLDNEEKEKKKGKQPKRVLHFYDGILEEYSSDEEEEKPKNTLHAQAPNPKDLPWAPWMSHMVHSTANSALAACDYVGEGIANFLGITSPKYFYEIEEYKRALEEEEELKKEKDAFMVGWNTGAASNSSNKEKYVHIEIPSPSREIQSEVQTTSNEDVQRF